MAHFSVTPTDTGANGAQIAAASTGQRGRFVAFGCANGTAANAAITLRLFDGTAAAGTLRATIRLVGNDSKYWVVDQPGKSVFPKVWFTSGNAVWVDLASTGSVVVWGEFVREP